MSSTKNLAQLFSQSVNQSRRSSESPSEKDSDSVQYNKHSKAVNAEDDSHFENTTFQLKRTRSLGLLDEFIAPTKKLIEEDEIENNAAANSTRKLNLDFGGDDALDNQFIENIDDEKQTATGRGGDGSEQTETFPPSPDSKVYASDDDYNDDEMEDDDFHNNDDNVSHNTNRYNKADTALSSPSSPSSASSLSLFQPHDDNDIVYEPSKQVDYLSHDWKESDVSKSWRYIVLKRKDVANSARLENASWRTWAQAKYHLKTISPEAVNWLKDSDVTWLYGPLYKEPSSQRNEVGYGSDNEGKDSPITAKKKQQRKGPKPILKKRTVCEILSQPSLITVSHRNGHHRRTGHSPIIEAYSENSNSYNLPSPPRIEDDFDEISRKVNAQYKSSSNTQLPNRRQQQQHQPQHQPQQSSQQPAQQQPQRKEQTITRQDQEHQLRSTPITTVMSNASSILSSKLESVSASADSVPKRHIHFNDRVEQCIAVDTSYDDGDDNQNDHDHRGSSDSDDSEDDAFADNDSDSDEEAGFFLMVRSPSAPQIHNQIPLTEADESDAMTSRQHEEQEQKRSNERYQTIALLPSTTLKYGSDDDEDYDNYALSHNVNTSRGFNYYYDYNSVFTSDASAVSGDSSSNSKFQFEQDITPQHLEGVNMVDVPENIVLGASVSETTPALTNTALLSETSPTAAASIHSHSNSGSDDSLNNKNLGSKENFTKVSSSPSYASLSDVAAQGYISHNPDSSNLSDVISFIGSGTATENAVTDDDKNIVDDEANLNNNHNNGNSFKNTILTSWKRS